MALLDVWSQVRSLQRILGLSMGADINNAPKTSRVQDSAGVAIGAVLIQLLLDKGLITTSDLTAAMNAAVSTAWPEEPDDL